MQSRKYSSNLAQILSGSCETSVNIVLDPHIDASWYKGCKEYVSSVRTNKLGRPCVTDNDCFFPWGNNSETTYVSLDRTCQYNLTSLGGSVCDTFQGVCFDTSQVKDELFWWCFLHNMSAPYQIALVVFQSIDPCNASAVLDAFSAEACVPASASLISSAIEFRTHYRYTSPIMPSFGSVSDPVRDHCDCFHTIGNEFTSCEDELCNKPPQCEYASYDRAPAALLHPEETSSKNDVCTYSFILQPQISA